MNREEIRDLIIERIEEEIEEYSNMNFGAKKIDYAYLEMENKYREMLDNEELIEKLTDEVINNVDDLDDEDEVDDAIYDVFSN